MSCLLNSGVKYGESLKTQHCSLIIYFCLNVEYYSFAGAKVTKAAITGASYVPGLELWTLYTLLNNCIRSLLLYPFYK